MQFRGIAENESGEAFEFRFTHPDWLGAVHAAERALLLELEDDEFRNELGPWIVRAVTLALGRIATADSSERIARLFEQTRRASEGKPVNKAGKPRQAYYH